MAKAFRVRWFIHLRNRAREYYGINWTWRIHDEIISLIFSGSYVEERVLWNGRVLYSLQYQFRLIRIVVDEKLRQATTLFPPKQKQKYYHARGRF